MDHMVWRWGCGQRMGRAGRDSLSGSNQVDEGNGAGYNKLSWQCPKGVLPVEEWAGRLFRGEEG